MTTHREIFDFQNTAYLAGSKALVIFDDSHEMVGDTYVPISVRVPDNMPKSEIFFVRRGTDNRQPVDVMNAVYHNSTVGANIAFNSKMAYGDGIMVAKKTRDKITNEIKIVEQLPSEQPEIFQFLTHTNYNNSKEEWANYIVTFYESYAEFIFARGGGNQIVQINSVESVYCRLSKANID